MGTNGLGRQTDKTVVPCYNEEEVLHDTFAKIRKKVEELIEKQLIHQNSRICFVDDGSTDRTWEIIEALKKLNEQIKGLKLSTNFGHQNALLAAMHHFRGDCDCMITIDADLQDDIKVLEEMVIKYQEGCSVVYGVRKNRDSDSLFKKHTALLFYKILKKLKVKTVYNHADFRLVDSKVLHEMNNFKEVNLYLRGLIPLVGFRHDKVYYDRKQRTAGETKYPLLKMLSLAWNSVTSFSIYPMRLILFTGVVIFIFSAMVGLWVLYLYLRGISLPGWASIVLPLVGFGGVQMISIGIIGEYIGKIYSEVKSRPRFIIEKEL